MGFFGRKWADVLPIIGAGLQDISDTSRDNLGDVTRRMERSREEARKREEEAAQKQAQAEFYRRVVGTLSPQGLTDVGKDGSTSQDRAMADPNLRGVMARLALEGLGQGIPGAGSLPGIASAFEPEQPKIIEGPDGLYEWRAGKGAKKIMDYPAKPNTTPGQVNPATGRWEWAPGYLEGQGDLSTVRRRAVVENPMPRVGGGGGRGGKPPKPKPWEKVW